MRALLRVAIYVAFIVLWEGAARLGYLNPFLLPAPTAVLAAFAEGFSELSVFHDLTLSLRRVLFGFLLAALTAIPLGLTVGWSERLRFHSLPVLQAVRPIPPIAWIPIAILWFGLGDGASRFITMLAAFFPIFINSYLAVRGIEMAHVHAARSLGASRRQIYLEVILPAVAPQVFAGLRIGLGIAWMSLIAAEIASAGGGLGYRMQMSQEMLRIDHVIAGMISIGLLGLTLDRLLAWMQARLLPWRLEKA